MIVFIFNLSPALEWELLEDKDLGLVIAAPMVYVRVWHKHGVSQRNLGTNAGCGSCPLILCVRKPRPRARKEQYYGTQGGDDTTGTGSPGDTDPQN